MRASKYTDGPHPSVDSREEEHISGAEGLYPVSDIPVVAGRFFERALSHPKGRVDKIIVTAELIRQKPLIIPALPVGTVISKTPVEGRRVVQEILFRLGITKKALHTGFAIIEKGGMRGASMISAEKGVRLEPDRQRGVRVSRLGITASASKTISSRLSHYGINTDTVKEALILASKVLSHSDTIAELCISDDPDYTTGYVASKKFGYVRIPHIRRRRDKTGGRAFFVREEADIPSLVLYLETMPVLIGKASLCKGTLSLHEILDNPDR